MVTTNTHYGADVWQRVTITHSDNGGTYDLNFTIDELGTANSKSFAIATTASSTGTADRFLFGGAGNSEGFTYVHNVTVTAVPEPSAFDALAGLGSLMLVALRRRRV